MSTCVYNHSCNKTFCLISGTRTDGIQNAPINALLILRNSPIALHKRDILSYGDVVPLAFRNCQGIVSELRTNYTLHAITCNHLTFIAQQRYYFFSLTEVISLDHLPAIATCWPASTAAICCGSLTMVVWPFSSVCCTSVVLVGASRLCPGATVSAAMVMPAASSDWPELDWI